MMTETAAAGHEGRRPSTPPSSKNAAQQPSRSPFSSDAAPAPAAPQFRRRRGGGRGRRHVVSHNPVDVTPMYGGGIGGGVIVKVECCFGVRDTATDGCDDDGVVGGVRSSGVLPGGGHGEGGEGEQADAETETSGRANKVIQSFLRSVNEDEKEEAKPFSCWTYSRPGKVDFVGSFGPGLPAGGGKANEMIIAPKRARLAPGSDGGGGGDGGGGNGDNIASSVNESQTAPPASDEGGVIRTILRAFYVAHHQHQRQRPRSSGGAGSGSWRSPPTAAPASTGRRDAAADRGGVALVHCSLDNGGRCRISVREEDGGGGGGGVATAGLDENVPAAKNDEGVPVTSPPKKKAEEKSSPAARPKRRITLRVEVDELGRSRCPLPCSSTTAGIPGMGSRLAEEPTFACSSLPFSFITTIASSAKFPRCVDKLERFLSLASHLECSVLLPVVDDAASAASGASILMAAGYREENPSCATTRSHRDVCLPRVDAAAYYRDGGTLLASPSVDGSGPAAARVALLRDLLGYVGAASCRLGSCLRVPQDDDDAYTSHYEVPCRHLAHERGGRLDVMTWEGRMNSPQLVDRLVRASRSNLLVPGQRFPFVAITAWWGCGERTRSGSGGSRTAGGATAILTPDIAPTESVLPSDGRWY